MKFVATKRRDNKFWFSSSFVVFIGSGISDPGSEIWDKGCEMDKNQDLGSGINIPDPHHW